MDSKMIQPDGRQSARQGLRFTAALGTILGGMALLALAISGAGAQSGELHERFAAHDARSTRTVDHAAWDSLLKAYLRAGEDGLNRFDYAGLKKDRLAELRAYLDRLQTVDPTKLARDEQFAFWTNLYNAKTIEIVASRFPVASIRDIKLTGFLVPGPWREKVVKVAGAELSLDDIEHGIMRPIWRDPRIHYAVNCSSVGCPNLAARAFTGARLELMLEDSARAYINSPRGVRFDGGNVIVSSLYDWYADDFGGSTPRILGHIRHYAGRVLKDRLATVSRIAGYEYSWDLNDVK